MVRVHGLEPLEGLGTHPRGDVAWAGEKERDEGDVLGYDGS